MLLSQTILLSILEEEHAHILMASTFSHLSQGQITNSLIASTVKMSNLKLEEKISFKQWELQMDLVLDITPILIVQ